MLASVNGQLIPIESASLRLADLAIQRGYGVFDYLKTVAGRPVFLDDHLDRLMDSCREMHLFVDRARIEAQVRELIAQNGIADSGVRITVTGGESADGYTIGTPTVVIAQSPLRIADDPAPVKLLSCAHRRQLPTIKTIDYLMAVKMRPVVLARGADEVVYHHDGVISECPRNNVFLVDADGRLATPGRDVLPGVTRRRILEMTDVDARDVTLDELRGAREAFVTSTTRNLVPIGSVDGHPIGDGRPGETTRRLQRLLAERIAADVTRRSSALA